MTGREKHKSHRHVTGNPNMRNPYDPRLMMFDEAYKDKVLAAVESLNRLVLDGARAGLLVEYRVESRDGVGPVIVDPRLFRLLKPTDETVQEG